jgi:peptidoglycan/xylan/chitin deacetylase (PgdA/CDA1 family)
MIAAIKVRVAERKTENLISFILHPQRRSIQVVIMSRFSSMLITILLVMMLFTGLVSVSATAQTTAGPFNNNSTLSASANASVVAAGVTSTSTAKKYVVFRDDDVGFGNLSALEAVDQVHIEENVPVTLAIIPHPNPCGTGNELLQETAVLNYLRSIENNSLFEFAQHGYNHWDYRAHGPPTCSASSTGEGVPQVVGAAAPYYKVGESPPPGLLVPGQASGAPYDSEFYGRSYTDQYNAIKQGRDDMIQALGVTPTTFVPPWNSGDSNTLKALTALGFTLYSTSTSDFNVRQASLQGIMVQGESTGLIGWDSNAAWQSGMQSLTQATDAALNNMTAGQSFVVGYHFWSFENPDHSVNPTWIALFKQYIDHLKSRGDVAFTTLAGQNLRQPTQLSLSANNANGEKTVFSGTVQTQSTSPVRLANSPIYLQVSTDNAHWSNAWAPTTTNSAGDYTFYLTLTPGHTYYFRTYYPGTTEYREAFSPVVTVGASTQATTLNLKTLNTGSRYTFYGALGAGTGQSPRISNANIYLQVSTDNAHWSNAWAPTTTNSAGDYTFYLTLTPGHTYYFRTYYPGSASYREAFSPTMKVAG